ELTNLVTRVPGNVETEASGGISLDNLQSYCQTGVDRVSMGSLTHSFRSLDIGLELIGHVG
ncbi:MAG: nicotinate-nucleotide diphosphorylase (carboxylating), partial [bacterium]